MDTETTREHHFIQARDEFIAQWGSMGSTWGINRTMAQIHALLLVSAEALCTDDIMEHLEISRGNAHGNLKDLVNWGIVRSVVKRGERKEFFEAEKDIWKMFCTISRERKRRELEPAVQVLNSCAQASEGIDCPDCREFNRQMKQLSEFVEVIGGFLDRFSAAEESKAIPLVLKMLK